LDEFEAQSEDQSCPAISETLKYPSRAPDESTRRKLSSPSFVLSKGKKNSAGRNAGTWERERGGVGGGLGGRGGEGEEMRWGGDVEVGQEGVWGGRGV